MKKKLLLASALVVPFVAVGGLWTYQALQFEKSIKHEVTRLKKDISTLGVALMYDDVKVSGFLFTAELVNPKISATLPEMQGTEHLKGLIGAFNVKGKVTARFSALSNAITIENEGTNHITTTGPMDLDFIVPETSKTVITIQRNEYDLFGTYPFISVKNIKCIRIDTKGLSLSLKDDKLMDIGEMVAEISLEHKGADAVWTYKNDLSKMQFYKMKNPISAEDKEVKESVSAIGTRAFLLAINEQSEIEATRGQQDFKFLMTVHIPNSKEYDQNIKTYIQEIKDGNKKTDFENFDFGIFFPEGIKLTIDKGWTKNLSYEASLNGSFERTKTGYPVNVNFDFTATDQWKVFCQTLLMKLADQMLRKAKAEAPAEGEVQTNTQSHGILKTLQKEKVYKVILPDLKSFGKTQISAKMDFPKNIITQVLKGTIDFKSDLYDVNATGQGSAEGVQFKLTTRNALPMLSDLQAYVLRSSEAFIVYYPTEIQSLNQLVKGGKTVFEKLLEPAGAPQQSFTIEISKEGNFKIGNYDLPQVMAMFNEAMTPVVPATEPAKS